MIKLFGKSQILGKDETLAVKREGTQIPENVVYLDGKPVKRNATYFHIQGTIQPMSGRDLLLVPEGDRFKEQFWIYAQNGSIVVNQGLDIQDKPTQLLVNDIVSRLGANYQVQEVEDWGSYCKARIMRVDTGKAATP